MLTDGTIVWDTQTNDFDWRKTNALPHSISGAYASEPKYLDATDLKVGDLSSRHAKIRNAAAEIYSRLSGRPLDEVIGDDVTQFRRNRASAAIAVAIILAAVIDIILFRAEADRQAGIATARQQLDVARSAALISLQHNGGPEALGIPQRDAVRSGILAAESVRLVPTIDGADALSAHLAVTPRRVAKIAFEEGFAFAALSRDGRSIVSRRGDELVISSTEDGRPLHRLRAQIPTFQLRSPMAGPRLGSEPRSAADAHVDAGSSTEYRRNDGACPRRRPLRDCPQVARFKLDVALYDVGNDKPLQRWSPTGMSMPISFSASGRYLAFPDGDHVAVVDVKDGTVQTSLRSDLVETKSIAVDNAGRAVLVRGWQPDPAFVIGPSIRSRRFRSEAARCFVGSIPGRTKT